MVEQSAAIELTEEVFLGGGSPRKTIFQSFRDSLTRTTEFVRSFFPSQRWSSVLPHEYVLAIKILGRNNFIPPEMIMARRSVVYTEEQLEALVGDLPSEDTLRLIAQLDCVLMAEPPVPLSVIEIRKLNPELFCLKGACWFTLPFQKFAHEDTTRTGWIIMPRELSVPNSTNMTWKKAQSLLSDTESVPNAAQVAWFVTTYYKVRGTWLFPNFLSVRTSSKDCDGNHVSVGNGPGHCVAISSFSNYLAVRNVGLAYCLKL